MQSYFSNKESSSAMHTNVSFGFAVFVILVLSAGVAYLSQSALDNNLEHDKAFIDLAEKVKASSPADEIIDESDDIWHFSPGPISMDLVKSNGCIADGFLSGYGGRTDEIAKTINNSKCVYLHRALETWLKPPDFSKAANIMDKINKRPLVYGMFLAEAIPTNRTYYDPESGKRFHYDKMCRDGTQGRWGNNTCIPSIQNVEYRRYIKAVTHRAMDMGIQSFMFGQLQFQDEHPNFKQSDIEDVINEMREYSQTKGLDIIIGGQTNNIADEKYLRLFDYIEGGVGIDSQGNIEDQPCSSKHESCWALLWDKKYSSKANNVLLHLDWSGMTWDDMGVFARMSEEKRAETLKSLYQKFNSKNTGFMMPYLAVLNRDNNGCYGQSKDFYSPSNKFGCKDEKAISKIMKDIAAQ